MMAVDLPAWLADVVGRARNEEDWRALAESYQSALDDTPSPEQRRLASRRVRGVYYTPALIAERLAGQTLAPILAAAHHSLAAEPHRREQIVAGITSLRILDPACGTGAFLAVAFKILWEFYQTASVRLPLPIDKDQVVRQLVGIDLDPVAAEICRLRLRTLAETKSADPDISSADTLRLTQAPLADIILTNPPFEVLTNFARNPEAALSARWLKSSGMYPLSARGQINLYRLFLERCLQWLHPGGRLGIVLPASFLGDRQATPLRQTLLSDNRVESIDILSERSRTFSDAMQGTCLMVAEKGRPTSAIRIPSDTVYPLSLQTIRTITPEWVIPNCRPELRPLLERLAAYPTFAEGPGGNCTAKIQVGELDLSLQRQHISDSRTDVMLIRGDHMGGRYIVDLTPMGERRWVKPEFLTGLVGKSAKTSASQTSRVVFQGIANCASSRRLRFAICPPRVVLGNSVNYLQFVTVDNPKLFYYLGILNAKLLNWRFCATSYGNNVNNYEVERLPLVLWEQAGTVGEEISHLAGRLHHLGLARQMDSAEAQLLDRRLDDLVYRLYGLTADEQAWVEEAK